MLVKIDKKYNKLPCLPPEKVGGEGNILLVILILYPVNGSRFLGPFFCNRKEIYEKIINQFTRTF